MAFYNEGDINSTKQGTGARANSGKVSFAQVPFHLLAGVARVFMGGKLKYASYNWAKGANYSVPFDSLMRHMLKWFYCREDIDEESGENHLDLAIANLLMLKHYNLTFKAGDDRPCSKLTHFPQALKDINTLFDEEAYLERNPKIKQLLEARDVKE